MLLYLTEQIQLDMQAKRGCTWLMPVYCRVPNVLHWDWSCQCALESHCNTDNDGYG